MVRVRQEQFKEELFALLRKYDVQVSVIESIKDYSTYVDGINFWSYTKYDEDGNEIEEQIDLNLGAFIDGKQ